MRRWARRTWSPCSGSRPSGGAGPFVPSLREYTALLGPHGAPGRAPVGRRRDRHPPGPMVRGVEIASDVADLPRTVVTQQVANGVAVRMAILFLLLGGELARRCRATGEWRSAVACLSVSSSSSAAAPSSGPTARPASTSPSRDPSWSPWPRRSKHRPAPRSSTPAVPGRTGPGRPAHAPAPTRTRGGRDD